MKDTWKILPWKVLSPQETVPIIVLPPSAAMLTYCERWSKGRELSSLLEGGPPLSVHDPDAAAGSDRRVGKEPLMAPLIN